MICEGNDRSAISPKKSTDNTLSSLLAVEPDGNANGVDTRDDSLSRRSSMVLTCGADHHTLSVRAVEERPASAHVGPFLIGVTGASASGKTTVCEKIIHGLGDQRCVLISLDWFYRGLPDNVNPPDYNFDHPNAFDYEALRETLEEMKLRKRVSVPKYDFTKHKRLADFSEEVDAADVIIVEGILTFYDKRIRDMLHMKIFVDEDPDICLVRRITRDVAKRGRTVDSVLAQYTRFVKPSFEEYILPTKRYSDIVVPRGGENLVAIDLIIKHSALKIRQDDMRKLYSNLIVMADSYQARGLHTIIRDRKASREDFVFYSERLMRLLIEESLGLLPFERKSVETPTGGTYYGVGFVAGLAALSMIPSGEAMESSLRAVCHTVRIGKILITDKSESSSTGNYRDREKVVKYKMMPPNIQNRHILVLAPVLNSGSECEHALRSLLGDEVGCREENIMILSLIVSPDAAKRICSHFPKVRLVVSAIDAGVDDTGCVSPGVGNFSERYFGTS